MKLNLGSGLTKIPGFLNVDSNPLCKPDILADVEKKLPFEDSSVDEIRAYHIFEHINDFFGFVQELYRICKHKAIIDIEVPHPRHDIFLGDVGHIRPITVENLKQFSKKYNQYEMEKWNSNIGYAISLDVDFEIVDFNYVIEDFYLKQFQNMKNEEIDRIARSYNNVISLIKIKWMAIKP